MALEKDIMYLQNAMLLNIKIRNNNKNNQRQEKYMYELKEELNIENMIYEIRGKQVMLDSDLAKLYNVETKRINEAVKNNPDKFPGRFYFRINENEFLSLKSKISTSKGGSRKGHNVFTEQGIAMLSTILKSKVAVETSIRIMDAFVKMRKYISANLIEQDNMKNMLIKHDNEIKLLQESFSKLEEKEKVNHIFYEGQIYDAYSLLIDIFKEAKKEIIIIDNYADKSILDMITNLNVKVTIVTKKFNLLKDIDIKKYNRQYHNLKVIYSNKFHDRFIIIDRKKLYHSGASYKDLGNKCFAITKIEDKEYLETILKNIGEDKCTN